MKIDLSNKVAFVTGASKGIGRAIAETLAACGASVALFARESAELRAVETAINQQAGGRALAVPGDAAKAEEVAEAIRQTVAHFGGLHLAVNNAGVAGDFGPLHESTPENWRKVLGVNLDGVFYAMKYELGEMLKAGSGSIVNIGSVEGHLLLAENPAYTTTKHGIAGLTLTAAHDYADKGIRINTVSPGVIKTPLTDGLAETTARLQKVIPMKRLGESQEIANTVAFLLSDLSSYTTGADIVVDGAYLLSGA
jgi:NAD(P)-dependent dehydrogenase (short-subunit alcohol dehydrogenase family)